MDTFRARYGLTDVAAASDHEAGKLGKYSEKTIHSRHRDFYTNKGKFEEAVRGKHSSPYILDDEICRKKHCLGYLLD